MAASLKRELSGLRARIDRADAELIRALARRQALARAVGRAKARAGAPVRDAARERAVLARARALASRAGLDPAFTARLFRLLLAESRRAQRR